MFLNAKNGRHDSLSNCPLPIHTKFGNYQRNLRRFYINAHLLSIWKTLQKKINFRFQSRNEEIWNHRNENAKQTEETFRLQVQNRSTRRLRKNKEIKDSDWISKKHQLKDFLKKLTLVLELTFSKHWSKGIFYLTFVDTLLRTLVDTPLGLVHNDWRRILSNSALISKKQVQTKAERITLSYPLPHLVSLILKKTKCDHTFVLAFIFCSL